MIIHLERILNTNVIFDRRDSVHIFKDWIEISYYKRNKKILEIHEVKGINETYIFFNENKVHSKFNLKPIYFNNLGKEIKQNYKIMRLTNKRNESNIVYLNRYRKNKNRN